MATVLLEVTIREGQSLLKFKDSLERGVEDQPTVRKTRSRAGGNTTTRRKKKEEKENVRKTELLDIEQILERELSS